MDIVILIHLLVLEEENVYFQINVNATLDLKVIFVNLKQKNLQYHVKKEDVLQI